MEQHHPEANQWHNDIHAIIKLTESTDSSSLKKQLFNIALRYCTGDIRLYRSPTLKHQASLLMAAHCVGKSVTKEYPLDEETLQEDLAMIRRLPRPHRRINCIESPQAYAFYLVTQGTEVVYLLCHPESDVRGVRQLGAIMQTFGNQMALLESSHTDSLTGLLNRHAYEERMAALYHRNNTHNLQRRSHDPDANEIPYCFAFIDIDHFKKINDRFGHLYGDEVLVLVAHAMQECFRDDDLLFRFGGEEFVVILKDSDLESSSKVLERFRRSLAKRDLPDIGRVTVSIGYATLDFSKPFREVADCADQALYFAKGHGRNAVACYERLRDAGLIEKVGSDSINTPA